MSFSCGIVGLPNSGKSTIFNALTALCVPSQPYPFCTIEPNTGIVPVPDERLARLGELLRPEKLTPTTIEFVDIAGLIKDAHKGEGLGNRFLSHIRNVDAIAHVLRLFDKGDVPHVYGDIDAWRDMGIVETEIIISDLEIVEERIAKIERLARVTKDKGVAEHEALVKAKGYLGQGRLLTPDDFSHEEWEHVSGANLISTKPVFYVANVGEDAVADGPVEALEEQVRALGRKVVYICGRLEEELSLVDESERASFMELYGMRELSINKVVRVGYDVLGLITFYTVVGKEIRAWTLPRNTPCAKAAGKIHTDMERGFIRAEVIQVEDLLHIGSEHAAREKGLLRVEGRDYLVQDGDILHIRFNV